MKLEVGTNCKVQICTNGNKSVIQFAKIETGSGYFQPEVEFNEPRVVKNYSSNFWNRVLASTRILAATTSQQTTEDSMV